MDLVEISLVFPPVTPCLRGGIFSVSVRKLAGLLRSTDEGKDRLWWTVQSNADNDIRYDECCT